MKGKYKVAMPIVFSAVVALLLVTSAAGALGQDRVEKISIEENGSVTAADELKNKTIYFHNKTGTVNNIADVLTMNTSMGDDQEVTDWTSSGNIQLDWYLNPTLAGNLTLNGTATSYMWINIKDASGGTNDITLNMDLYELYPDGTEDPIGSGSHYYGNIRTIFNEYSVSTELDEYELAANSTIHVQVSIDSSTNFDKRVAYGNPEYPSRLEVETDTYIQPETLTVLDSEFNESSSFRLGADNTTINFNASVVDPFGGYDINRVNITVEGPDGTVFYREPMTQVTGNDTTYGSNYTYRWDYGGAPEGDYTVIVSAVDNTGYYYRYPDNPGDETYGGHLESIEKDFYIGAERHHVHFKTLDASERAMEGANVTIYSDGAAPEPVEFNQTNQEGVTNISIREGSYVVRVYWQDVIVNETTYDVTTDVSYPQAVELNCSVYDANHTVLDSRDNTLQNANLLMRHPNGTVISRGTDANGEVNMEQMAGGEYIVQTEWLGKEVNETEYDLDSNIDITIQAEVFYLEIKTLDTRAVNISEVHTSVRFNDTERLATAGLTDVNGELTLRLPGTAAGFGYDISFDWRGVDVGRRENYTLENDRNLEVQLEIYYVEIHAVDTIGEDLESASIEAYNIETDTLANSGETNEQGELTLRLPKGLHQISVRWKGLEVYDDEYEVTGDDSMNLECSVYHVDFEVVDSRGEPVSGSRVTVSHPDVGLMGSETADENGTVSMRLPGASLDVEVEWRGVVVFSEPVEIDSNDPVPLEVGVYYLEVEVVDDLEEPLENAQVELYYQGTFLDEDTTNESGLTEEIRLPGAEMRITVSWKGVQVYEDDIVLDSDTTANLQAAVYHVDFHAQDDLGVEIPDASLRVTHVGNLLLSGRTDVDGNLSGRIPGAVNRVTLDWKGVRVYSEEFIFDTSEELILEVEAVHHLNYTVIDSRGEPLEKASFDIYSEENHIGSRVTDSDGFLTIRAPTPHDAPGEIDIYGRWRDVSVYEENFTIDSHVEEDLEAEVYYIDYTVVDDRGEPVENAKVIGRHSELPERQNIITDRLTDENGYILFRLPRGEQEFTVNWRGITIYDHTIDLTSDTEETIDSHVYYLSMQVLDESSEPLEDAFVRITYHETPRLYHSDYTGESGEVQARIPMATWDIQVEWMNKIVYEEEYEVTQTEEIELETTVYYLTMNVVDDEGEPLGGAHVSLDYADTGEFYHSELTGSDGQLEVRIPEAAWDITVEWKGITVYEEEYEVTATEEIDIETSVYYLTLDVVDDEGEVLEAARISLTYGDTGEFYDAKYTGQEGTAEFRLPEHTWGVTVRWMGVEVYEESHEVLETAEVEIETSVYHLNMEVVDDRGIPLENARVKLTYNETGLSYTPSELVTDSSGEIHTRLPEETWSISVRWMKTIVYEEEHEVNSTEEMEISTDVYYLTVKAEDADGVSLDDVHVRVMTRQQSWTGYTENGTAEFRLPARDDYEVMASFRTTYYLTEVDVQESDQLTLSEANEHTMEFEEYPIPFYETNLFYIILVLVALLAILGFAYHKKKGKAEEELEEEPEEEGLFEEESEEEELEDTDETEETDEFEEGEEELEDTDETEETDEFEEGEE
ncbi:MAG: carboxypeptidase-like regulatory domain-containing protein, partial [Candidatus Natronoplasma sp.]